MTSIKNYNKAGEAVITKEVIVNNLTKMGLGLNNIIEVHSSLSSFGIVDGGAPIVVDALMEIVGPKGTIIMSAYPMSPPIPLTKKEKTQGIKWKVKRLDLKSNEKTGMGTISDEFKSRKDVYLGTNLHRVAAWGKSAKKHSGGYRYFLELDGLVLLIGVGIDRCSSLHLAENDTPIPQEIKNYEKIPSNILKNYPKDEWSIGFGETPHDAWQKVFSVADQKGLIQHHKIGSAKCLLFKANDVAEILKKWRSSDPYGLYGIKRI
ncbi:AAC(3) family N-acetyltransferase [Patescibacteria group bacterium]|nr:AAC(3) family N-acetyltransferase [Patescibacteria group bacterium]MBU1885540.1 AAC(3) family N-acetyltransferase [Patescibacteria group bacterium]